MDHTATQTAGLIADRVQSLISESGLTLRDLADATGIPRTTLHRRLKKTVAFDVAELHLIALELGTTLGEIARCAEAQQNSAA